MPLLADVNDRIDKFLGDNPVILGLIALLFALVFLGLAVSTFVTGRAPTDGKEDLTGGKATAMGAVWLMAGVGCLLFALFKIGSGLLR